MANSILPLRPPGRVIASSPLFIISNRGFKRPFTHPRANSKTDAKEADGIWTYLVTLGWISFTITNKGLCNTLWHNLLLQVSGAGEKYIPFGVVNDCMGSITVFSAKRMYVCMLLNHNFWTMFVDENVRVEVLQHFDTKTAAGRNKERKEMTSEG